MEQAISKCTTRDSILEATLKIIGEEGIQNVTVRKIARLADVNVAAVNYHFGSKDLVINEALRYLTEKLKDAFKFLANKNEKAEKRLEDFIRAYADAALEHPDVFRNYVSHSMFDEKCDYAEFIKHEGLLDLKNTLGEIDRNKNDNCSGISSNNDDDRLLMRCFQIISVLAFPVLLGKQMQKVSGIEYDNCEARYLYLDVLMKTLVQK